MTTESTQAPLEPTINGQQIEEAAPPATTTVTIPDNWKEVLPEDLRNDPNVKIIPNIEALAKSYVHAQKMIGVDKIPVPNEYTTPEEWNTIYKKLGVPQEADKYKVNLKDEFKELVKDEELSEFKQRAMKAGVFPKQAEELLNWYAETSVKQVQQQEQIIVNELKQGIDGLKSKWGATWDDNINSITSFVKTFGNEAFNKFIQDPVVNNNAGVLEFLHKVSKTIYSEDDLSKLRDAHVKSSTAVSPDEASQKLNSIMGNQDHAYWKGDHPGHKDALAEVMKLREYMNPHIKV